MDHIDVSIIGAGAVGISLANALIRAHISVELVVRPERFTLLSQRGLWLKQVGTAATIVNAPLTTCVNDSTKLIILTPKTFALRDAIKGFCAHRDAETTVLAVQNGINSDALLHRLAPRVSAWGAVAIFTATSLHPGEVELHLQLNKKPTLVIGVADGQILTLMRTPAWQLLSRALKLVPTSSLEGARFTKLLVNLNNGLLAATRLPAQQFYTHPQGLLLSLEILREGLWVQKATQVKLAKIPTVSPFFLQMLMQLPEKIALALLKRRIRKMLISGFVTYGSTLQSLLRGEPTEIDDLNGEIVRMARSYNIATPLNDAVVAAVKAQGRGESPTTIDALASLTKKSFLRNS